MDLSQVVEAPDRLADVHDVDPQGELEGLEHLPSVASEAGGHPWGAVTLVEADRQRTLAQAGELLPDELPIEHGFCPHALGDPDEVFVVSDAREADAFRDNPLVQEQGVRFYAGAPVTGPRGHAIGTVCVLDDEPATVDAGERALLGRLADLAGVQLTLAARARELEDATRELEQFAGIVSHELRDPLSQTAMNLELISDRVPPEDRILRDLVDDAQEGARRMERLTRDLLQYARARDGSVETTTVDLDAVAREVLDALEPLVVERGASVELGGLGTVEADPSLVRQVLHNLVENALHHSGERPRVRVRARDEDDRTRILVEDDGKGVPPEEHDQLFEMFGQGSGAREEESTGVGLAFCKRVVERHGGQVGVDSEPGEGATFWFTLPTPDA